MTHEPFRCRSCGRPDPVEVLDLGRTPLANALLDPDDPTTLAAPEPAFPLVLAYCPGCALVQITETVPPEVLFRSYFYFSSFSDTMLRHAEAIATRLARARGLGRESLVVEVASNDGYLLQYYQRAGVPVLGIEPAANVARVAREEKGVPTRCEFFGADLAERLRSEGARADVLHANNVLAHVADLNGFVKGIARVLKDTGVAVIEAPYLRDMIDGVEFDTIYHEHLCYFSLTALDNLFRRHGLAVTDVERLAIHGGSLRVFVTPEVANVPASPAVTAMLEAEIREGTGGLEYLRAFGARVARLKAVLTGLLADLKRAGRTVAAYGASAKGSTLLNTFGIGRETLDFVVDRSTYKQGRLTPGTRLPIVAPAKLLEARPDYVLLLTWNFADEILAQQAEYRAAGGKFIVPVPDVRVV